MKHYLPVVAAFALASCTPVVPTPTPTASPTTASPTPTATGTASPLPTPTLTPTKDRTVAPCAGEVVSVDEVAVFRPHPDKPEPSYVWTGFRIVDGVMTATVVGGYDATEYPDGYVNAVDVTVGETLELPHAGRATLLDVMPASGPGAHGTVTFCWEPSPELLSTPSA